MILCDVNVFVYAFREDMLDHARYRRWLEDQVNGPAAFGLSELVLSGFLRVVTHPKIFAEPSTLAHSLDFIDTLRGLSNCRMVAPGSRHWSIFTRLCDDAGAKGNLIPDAYHAALTIEHGCEWITTDRGFARFPGLNWRHPLS